MTTTLRLQYTSVRTRDLDGQVLIGIKHTARDATNVPIKTPWIEMTPDDAKSLVKALQETLNQSPTQAANIENRLLKTFCLSLLKERAHPQVALARLLTQIEDLEGLALFSEWSEAEVQALFPTANALLEELRQHFPS